MVARRSLWLLVAAVLLALAAALALWPRNGSSQSDAVPRPVASRGALHDDERNNIEVFKRVSPSVVNITTLAVGGEPFSLERAAGAARHRHRLRLGRPRPHRHQLPRHPGRQRRARHARRPDAPTARELVGVFPDRDIAVLQHRRAEGPSCRRSPSARSGDLQVGQKVYAIGNPFGLDQTLTTGIVSALNREIESVTRRTIRGVIQTDAAINPGNSGGPLLDSAGRLIGVNTAIYSPSGASAGIGFAIPVDEVNRIVPRLIRDGRMVRPALGVAAGPEQHDAGARPAQGRARWCR